jgi:hypothetical protein
MDKMDEKQITFGQLLQVKCFKEKRFPTGKRQNGNPNHVFGGNGNNFFKIWGLTLTNSQAP